MIQYLLILFLAIPAISQVPPVEKLMTAIEDFLTLSSDVKSDFSITQQKADQGTKQLQGIWYRRDVDNSVLFVFTGPETEKGNGYLYTGSNLWMYRVNTRTFQHINRDESIAGTDAKAQDFEARKFTDLYEPMKTTSAKDSITTEKLGQITVYRFTVKANVRDVSYPIKTYWVRTDNYLPLKEQSISSSNALMQTTYYLNYTEINKKFIPVKQIFIDEFEKGNKTIMELSNIQIEKVSDQIFTKAYLENLSK